MPDGAWVHASVDAYLRRHADYWYRQPRYLNWADIGWSERAERLVAPAAEAASAFEQAS